MDEETATRKLISLGARFQMAIDPWPIALPILVYAGTYHNEITKNGLTPQAIDVIRVPMIGNEINNNNYSLAFDHEGLNFWYTKFEFHNHLGPYDFRPGLEISMLSCFLDSREPDCPKFEGRIPYDPWRLPYALTFCAGEGEVYGAIASPDKTCMFRLINGISRKTLVPSLIGVSNEAISTRKQYETISDIAINDLKNVRDSKEYSDVPKIKDDQIGKCGKLFELIYKLNS